LVGCLVSGLGLQILFEILYTRYNPIFVIRIFEYFGIFNYITNNDGHNQNIHIKMMEQRHKSFKEIFDEVELLYSVKLSDKEYVQLPEGFIGNIETDFIYLVRQVTGFDFIEKFEYDRHGFIGRIVSDNSKDYPYMIKVYNTIALVDYDDRLFQQFYYASKSMNGQLDISEMKCVNDKHPELLHIFRNRTISNILESQ